MGKKEWVCEECGREFDKLPFPSECDCGNWCEDYFREKDIYDYEDDKAGRPLLGVKYDKDVLEERAERLDKKPEIVTQLIDSNTEIDFSRMDERELLDYIESWGYDSSRLKTREELLKACKVFASD